MNIRLRFLVIAFSLFIICLTNAKSDFPTGSNYDKIQGSGSLLDSVQIFSWDSTEWVQTGWEKYIYDSLKRLITLDKFNWNNTGGKWIDKNTYEYYDSTKYERNITFISGSLYNYIELKYDSLWKLVKESISNNYTDEIRIYYYSYDSLGNCDYIREEMRLRNGGYWVEQRGYKTFRYNLKNQLIEKLSFSANGFIKDSLVYKYDNSDSLLAEEHFFPNDYDSILSGAFKYEYLYKNTFLISKKLERWSINFHNWIHGGITNYFYDSDGDLSTEIYQKWVDSLEIYENINKRVYFYRKPNSVSESRPISDNIMIFPNPAGSEINIALPGNISNFTKVEVIDITGRQVFNSEKTNDAQSNVQLDISTLPTGYYLVKVLAGNGVYAGYFIKE
jgi:hypothetical protein